MKTIDELWYGNISPFEQCTRGDKRLKELLKLVARNREDLDGTLTDKQKETLEKFEESKRFLIATKDIQTKINVLFTDILGKELKPWQNAEKQAKEH